MTQMKPMFSLLGQVRRKILLELVGVDASSGITGLVLVQALQKVRNSFLRVNRV